VNIAHHIDSMSDRMRESSESGDKRYREVLEAGAATDSRLNALIAVVDGLVRDRSGRGPQPPSQAS
jgi:hypothetical protein